MSEETKESTQAEREQLWLFEEARLDYLASLKTKRQKNQYGLTAKEEAFCHNLLICKTKIEAYVKSYDTKTDNIDTLYKEASDLAKQPKIKKRYEQLSAQAASAAVLTAQQILENLSALAQTAQKNTDKIRALELLGKYRKIFDEETLKLSGTLNISWDDKGAAR
jgi:hypothetical protein